MDSYSRTFVSTLQPLLFQIFSNLPNTAFALPIRVLISLSQLLFDDITLPKKQKSSPSSIGTSSITILSVPCHFPIFMTFVLSGLMASPTFAASVWTLSVNCFIPSHLSMSNRGMSSAKSRSMSLSTSVHLNPKVFSPVTLDSPVNNYRKNQRRQHTTLSHSRHHPEPLAHFLASILCHLWRYFFVVICVVSLVLFDTLV